MFHPIASKRFFFTPTENMSLDAIKLLSHSSKLLSLLEKSEALSQAA